MRRRVPTRRSGGKVVTGKAHDAVTLDDRPLELIVTRNGKRLIAVLPFDVWIVNAGSLEPEHNIELKSPVPSAFEGPEDGVLWLGGKHLFRGNLFSSSTTKIGTKLGGFVDRVCQLTPTLLCGVGSQGEVLFDVEKETVVHRRKTGERPVYGLVAGADGRAAFADGTASAWVMDPEHPSGYMKLHLRGTGDTADPRHAIVALGETSAGHCILGAQDGAIGWTNRALRLKQERYPADGATAPLALGGDHEFAYVLRPGGRLERYRLVEPEPAEDPDPDEPLPPPAQSTRLSRIASAMCLVGDGQLVLGGGHAGDQLGRLWRVAVDELDWTPLPLGTRPEPDEPKRDGPSRPSFVATKSRLEGDKLASLAVDRVLGAAGGFFITTGQGPLLERPVARTPADEVLPADAVLLPAMVRFSEGTARPALLLWPGTASAEREPPPLQWVVWGDEPRGWTPLQTLSIREQGWGRRDVFPLQVALPTVPEDLAGHRTEIPARWREPELFDALARECKKLLKVLW